MGGDSILQNYLHQHAKQVGGTASQDQGELSPLDLNRVMFTIYPSKPSVKPSPNASPIDLMHSRHKHFPRVSQFAKLQNYIDENKNAGYSTIETDNYDQLNPEDYLSQDRVKDNSHSSAVKLKENK